MKTERQFTDLIDILQLPTFYLHPPDSMPLTESSSFELKFKCDAKLSFRRLSKLHHPDHGGDPALFRSVYHAYRSIHRYKLENKPAFSGVGISVSISGVSLMSKSDGGWTWVKK